MKNPTIPVHSSSWGEILPPPAAIWSLKAFMTIGSLEVLGSISFTDSILIVRRFALWREPMIE